MVRILAWVALVAAAGAVVACSGGDSDGVGNPGRDWDDIVSSLEPGIDGSSSNPCQAGEPVCLDIVIAEMEERLAPLADQCDHDALFATMYLRTTEQIQRAHTEGRFEAPPAAVHITAWFAKYYFDAYDAWHGGDHEAVPEAWRIAFQAADERDVRGIGNLLLGMNAHVSRDLPYVVADVLDAPRDEVDSDYALVNTIIEELSTDVIREVGERFDPSVSPAQLPLAMGGAESFGALVTIWRTDSWSKGVALLRADDAEARDDVADRIEFEATSRALALLPEVSYLPFVEGPETRDAHCAEAGE